jgi:hypothetical protein
LGLLLVLLRLLGVRTVHLFGITVDNLHNKLLSMGSSSGTSNEVHRAKTVHALVFTNNVDVATTTLLQVSNSLTATANDKTNGAVRNHDLG